MIIQTDVFPSIEKPWLKYYDNPKSKQYIDINKSIYDFAYDLNKYNFDEPGLNYYGKIISKKEFFLSSRYYGIGLNALGIIENDVVSLLMPTMPQTYYVLYGCNYIGAIINPIDIRTSLSQIIEMLRETKTKVLFIHEMMADNKVIESMYECETLEHIVVMPSPVSSLNKIKRIVGKELLRVKFFYRDYNEKTLSYKTFLNLCYSSNRDAVKSKKRPEDVSVLMHTSGTTGDKPKTVMANDKNINFMASQYMKSLMNLKRGMVSIDIMPKWIFYGYLGIHMPLCIGMTVVPIADPVNEHLSDIINRFRPQSVAGVPSHAIDLLNNRKVKDLSSLTTIGIGGDSMPIAAEKELNALLCRLGAIKNCSPGYGASENTSVATANQGDVYKIGSVGIPFVDVDFMVIDKDQYENKGIIQEVTYNTRGILCFGGNLMMGYYKNNVATEDVIKEYRGKKWYISGDLGYIDEDGFVFFLNREKDLIVGPDGFKIVPKVIEDIVSENKAVKQCVVVGKKDSNDTVGEHPCCFIVLKKGYNEKIVKKEIVRLLKQRVSTYYLPTEYVFCDSIPYTAMGKIDRKKISDRDQF